MCSLTTCRWEASHREECHQYNCRHALHSERSGAWSWEGAHCHRLASPGGQHVHVGRDAAIGLCQPRHNVGGVAAHSPMLNPQLMGLVLLSLSLHPCHVMGRGCLYQDCGCCHSEGEAQHVLVSGVGSSCRSAWPRCLPDWSTGSGSVEVGVVLSSVHLTQELPALNAQQCFVDAYLWRLQAHIVLGCRPAIDTVIKIILLLMSYRDSQHTLHVSG